jgi:hypothetical protein
MIKIFYIKICGNYNVNGRLMSTGSDASFAIYRIGVLQITYIPIDKIGNEVQHRDRIPSFPS